MVVSKFHEPPTSKPWLIVKEGIVKKLFGVWGVDEGKKLPEGLS